MEFITRIFSRFLPIVNQDIIRAAGPSLLSVDYVSAKVSELAPCLFRIDAIFVHRTNHLHNIFRIAITRDAVGRRHKISVSPGKKGYSVPYLTSHLFR